VLVSGNAGKSTVQAGWYPDPDDATLNRWWDGSAWTNHRSTLAAIQARADAAAKSARSKVSDTTASVASRVEAVSVPITSSPIYDSISTSARSTSASSTSSSVRSAIAAPRDSSSQRPVSASRTFGAPKEHKKLPEISQPSNAGYTTAAVFAIISVIVGAGIIVGLLFS